MFHFSMVLKRLDKERLVEELAESLRVMPSAVVASFRGLPMSESTALRRTLRAAGGRLRVVPKRLFQRVMEQLGWAVSVKAADSIVVAWSSDLRAPAQALHEYMKTHGEVKFLGGVLEGKSLDGPAVERLALLPPLEALRAQFVSVLAGPVRGLIGVCGSVLRGLPAVLQAKAQA